MPRKKESTEQEAQEISLKDKMYRSKKRSDVEQSKEDQKTQIITEKLTQSKPVDKGKPSGLKKAKLLAETVTGKKSNESPNIINSQSVPQNPTMYNGQQINYGQVPGAQQPINIIVQVPENNSQKKEEPTRYTLSDAEVRKTYEKWNEEEKENQKVGKTIARRIGGTIINLVVAAIVFLVVKIFLITIVPLSGDSMSPTYHNKDKLLMEKVSYYIRDPEIDEIIYLKLDNGTNLVKRVVGIPGDTIQIIGGVLYRNEEPVETGLSLMSDAGIAANKIKLEYDEYFVLGDNRNDSNDSRNPVVGVIDRDQIKGRIIFKIWPLSNSKKSQSEDEAVGM